MPRDVTDSVTGMLGPARSAVPSPAPAWEDLEKGLGVQLPDDYKAALKCVYLAVMSLDPTGTGRKRWTLRWAAALKAFEITFDGRITAGRR